MHYADVYAQYLIYALPNADLDIFSHVEAIVEKTNWDEPTTPFDHHNRGVIEIIKAEYAPNLTERQTHFDSAFKYFQSALAYPLARLHYWLLFNLIGEKGLSINNIFSVLINYVHPYLGMGEVIPAGLVYLPPQLQQALARVLTETNGFCQSHLLIGALLTRVRSFYVQTRLIGLADVLLPDFTSVKFKHALAHLWNQQHEGLLYLHQAQKQDPAHPTIIQALYLAYRKLQLFPLSTYWKNLARDYYLATDPQNPLWFWSALPEESAFTYVLLQGNILLAVLPDLSQVITVVLLADGDWLEDEMEFWVHSLQPGMTVIDVGANVGVYTFTAARAVGETGCVIAIEPFVPCITCLE
ncbi:MAG: FkbM family methyltransferase, partial [Pseudanabaenaceae cyanobacterium]